MNKLNLRAPSFTNLPTVGSVSTIETIEKRPRRLIVLISPEMDCASLTRRLCKLAAETNSDIQLLGRYKDSTQELALHRELIMAAALIREAKVYVESSLETGTDWLAAVKRNYQVGDIIVCISDQSVGIRRKPLSQILESAFKVPVYILTTTKPMQPPSSLRAQVVAWSGLVGIIVGFFILQAQIIGLPDNGSKTVLSILILIPELFSIMFWNSLF